MSGDVDVAAVCVLIRYVRVRRGLDRETPPRACVCGCVAERGESCLLRARVCLLLGTARK